MKRLPAIIYLLGASLYAFVFFKNAWVGDDAYIVFRSLEQLLDGNGPRWNPHERVQVFTSPLWYWLLAAMGSLYRNHYVNSIVLSAACNILTLWNLQRILRSPGRWFFAILLLIFSQAYFDFTSSGLENPLGYALLSIVARFFLNNENISPHKARTILFAASGLLLITRHDLALFVFPLLAQQLYLARHEKNLHLFQLLALLLLPLMLWTIFSLLYYGFPFPNTAYAKLTTQIPREQLLQRGMLYFSTSIVRDFVSIVVLLAGLAIGICQRNGKLRLITAGIALHLAYIVWIGGDFMRGRFFSWDYLLCVLILLNPPADLRSKRWLNRNSISAGMAGLAMIASIILWEPPAITPFHWGTKPFKAADTADGITQERNFYFWFTAFWKYALHDKPLLQNHGWCQDSFEQKKQGIPVASAGTVGFRGYCLGTQEIIVDTLGITDPLLARLARNPAQTNWRPGHFLRLIPAGYCSTLKNHSTLKNNASENSPKNLIENPDIAAYYNKIRLLTQAEKLFSTERLTAILQMNTGSYSSQLDAINKALTENFLHGNGRAQQAEAVLDCPAIELPQAMIEQLKNAED